MPGGHGQSPPEMVEAPTPAELYNYIQRHWIDFAGRFSRVAKREQEAFTLVSLSGAECRPGCPTAYCSFDATARSSTGDEVTQELESSFRRDEQGRLEEYIILETSPIRRP